MSVAVLILSDQHGFLLSFGCFNSLVFMVETKPFNTIAAVKAKTSPFCSPRACSSECKALLVGPVCFPMAGCRYYKMCSNSLQSVLIGVFLINKI